MRRKRKGRKTDGLRYINLISIFVSFQEFTSSCEALSWIKRRSHSYNHEVDPGHHGWGEEGREVSIPVSLHLASLTNRLPCRESTRALFLYLKKIATTPNKHNYSFQKVVFAKRRLVDLI